VTNAQILKVVYFPYQEFDERGNLVYYENDEQIWRKWEYDHSGNMVYREDSDEYWEKWEYDVHRNSVYYENCTGHIWRKEQ